jgi:hypothetical protein
VQVAAPRHSKRLICNNKLPLSADFQGHLQKWSLSTDFQLASFRIQAKLSNHGQARPAGDLPVVRVAKFLTDTHTEMDEASAFSALSELTKHVIAEPTRNFVSVVAAIQSYQK